MSRHRIHIELPKPSTVPTAPHRFTWDSDTIDGSFVVRDGQAIPSLRDFMALSPYKVGDVIMVTHGEGFKRAYVSLVGHDYDRFGDRMLKYRVHTENAKGDVFSKNFYYVWPGMIQRGYQRAGLAPDCDGKL